MKIIKNNTGKDKVLPVQVKSSISPFIEDKVIRLPNSFGIRPRPFLLKKRDW
ncbi:MAG: hypothetical protein J4400_05050 [Candidatus Aenigmarchaeota archaeon]|nr:hypothetical protein [Candidatus Aenigmarchaeota archaeon]